MWSLVFDMVGGIFKAKSSILIDVVLGLLLVLIAGYGYHTYTKLQNDRVSLRRDLTIMRQREADFVKQINKLKDINEENIKTFEKNIKKYKQEIKLLKIKRDKDIKRAVAITAMKERIRYVKKSDDGVVAPVLSDTLGRLWKLQTSTAESGNYPKSDHKKR